MGSRLQLVSFSQCDLADATDVIVFADCKAMDKALEYTTQKQNMYSNSYLQCESLYVVVEMHRLTCVSLSVNGSIFEHVLE